MADLHAAAQSLIKRLNAPAQFHSVWIRNEVDPNTKQFVQHICVSVRPGHESQVKVPSEHQGVPVVLVPWPEAT